MDGGLLLGGVLLAAGLSGAIAYGFGLFSRGRLPPVVAAFALAIGYAAGEIAMRGFVGWWPTEPTRRLPWWVALAVGLVALEAVLARAVPNRACRVLVAGIRAAASAAGAYLLTLALRPGNEGADTFWLGVFLALAILLASQWWVLDRAARRDDLRSLVALTWSAGSAAAVVATAGWAGPGEALAALAACLAVVTAVRWLRPDVRPAPGVIPGFVLAYYPLVACAFRMGDLPAPAAGLLAVSPGLACALALGRVRSPARSHRLLRMTLLAAPAAAALAVVLWDLAGRSFPGEKAADGSVRDYCYVASFDGRRIDVFTLDPISGKPTHTAAVPAPGKPMAMTVDEGHGMLFVSHYFPNLLASFRIDPPTGGLTLVSTVPAGSDPTYLTTDRAGRFLLTACFESGEVMVHAIGPDGVLEAAPRQTVATAPHAHAVELDPSERVAVVPHTAPTNAIHFFRFDAPSGALTPTPAPPVLTSPAAPRTSPRHAQFRPSGESVYILNEQGRSVTTYRVDYDAGTLHAGRTVPTVPAGYVSFSACAEIRLHPSGRYLYVSNRGYDSIACFRVDPADGDLTPLGHVATERMPRSFDFDPSGRFLYVIGEVWGRMSVYRVDADTGGLRRVGIYDVGRRPVWVRTARVRTPM